ncbi:MAG: hypothetical protein FE041_03890 [Thermoplasmata archaeon]|nr:MAG: hypothetical protein FE041_03890 [Thermoplasmata archaeon]
MKALTLLTVALFFMPYFPSTNEMFVKIKANEVKTMEFPIGTKISIEGNVKYSIARGIKNGERKIFLSIYSEKNATVRVKYELPHKTMKAGEYDFLIIAPDKWVELIAPLKEHKESYGIKTKVVGLGEIYNRAKGRDDAEKIKYFIKDAIEEWGIKYVLLVGGRKYTGTWLIPVRYTWLNDRSSSWEYERRFISDLYYADVYNADGSFSSWDTNNNGYYGEYDHEIDGKKLSDKLDLYPDVYLGRLACRNERELKRVIKNIIDYENGHLTKKAILCGGDLYLHDPWDVAEGEYLLEEIAEKMRGYEIVRLYASEELNFRKINDAINEGADFVIFEGAGNHHLWATHAKDNEEWIYYYAWNIMQLKNEHLPIVLTSGARLGQFNRSRECFNWLFVSKGKAVASIGPTGLCWIGHGENVTKIFLGRLHILLCQEMTSSPTLGEAWGNAITEYLSEYSWQGVAKAFHMKAAEELELFGDPTLKIGYGTMKASTVNKIFHVGGNGPNNYTRIQEAINDASDGDTIIVHEGIYIEDLLIDKSLTIMGRNARIKTNGIVITAPDVSIEGFHIEGYGKGDGITCYGNGLLLKSNEIRLFNKSIVISAENCIIEGNEIKNNECGIWLNSIWLNSSWLNAEIRENTIKSNWYGIWMEKASASIERNNFSYNQWYALWVEGNDGKIEENTFFRNWYSIYLYNSQGFEISSNVIISNMHGPQFVNSIRNNIEGNTIKKNEHYGIYFGWRSKDNIITKNNFIENAQNARDDAGNEWQSNYWSDYIGLRIKILWLLHIPYFIPKFSFDWHPALEPYSI